MLYKHICNQLNVLNYITCMITGPLLLPLPFLLGSKTNTHKQHLNVLIISLVWSFYLKQPFTNRFTYYSIMPNTYFQLDYICVLIICYQTYILCSFSYLSITLYNHTTGTHHIIKIQILILCSFNYLSIINLCVIP